MPTTAAGYQGKDFLLKLGASVGAGTAPYAIVAGMRATSLAINNDMIDVTSKSSMPWRTLIAGGVQSVSLSASGVFSSDSSLSDIMTLAMSGALANYQILTGKGDTFSGIFKMSKLERNGEYKGEEQYSITLESSGVISYVLGTL